MGSVSVLACRCCMFVSKLHPGALFNVEICLHGLQLVNAGSSIQ